MAPKRTLADELADLVNPAPKTGSCHRMAQLSTPVQRLQGFCLEFVVGSYTTVCLCSLNPAADLLCESLACHES